MKTALMVCKHLAGKFWECKLDILTWVYIMIVRLSITYEVTACRFCGEEEEDSINIFINCGALIYKRQRCLEYYCLDRPTVSETNPYPIIPYGNWLGEGAMKTGVAPGL